MMTIRDLLHDQQDAIEDIQERWENALEEIRQSMLDDAQTAEGFQDLLELIQIKAADALADMTTDAVRVGVAIGKKKVEAVKE